MEQTVSRIGPSAFQHHKPEMFRTGVVRILNKLAEESPSIPGILVDICQESLDRLDLI